MAAQLTATNGLSVRRDCPCTVRAITSLPVPLSPVIKIGASESATCSASCITACMAGSRVTSGRESPLTAASTAAINSMSGGSGINSRAPARMALAAASGEVSTPQATTGVQMRSASFAVDEIANIQAGVDHQ